MARDAIRRCYEPTVELPRRDHVELLPDQPLHTLAQIARHPQRIVDYGRIAWYPSRGRGWTAAHFDVGQLLPVADACLIAAIASTPRMRLQNPPTETYLQIYLLNQTSRDSMCRLDASDEIHAG